MMNEQKSPVPDYLQEIYDILKCAFPDGIGDAEYSPVISLLYQIMSFRTMSEVLSVLTNKSYALVYNDVSGFGQDPLPPVEEIEKVRRKLAPCGYEEWFEKNKF